MLNFIGLEQKQIFKNTICTPKTGNFLFTT